MDDGFPPPSLPSPPFHRLVEQRITRMLFVCYPGAQADEVCPDAPW